MMSLNLSGYNQAMELATYWGEEYAKQMEEYNKTGNENAKARAKEAKESQRELIKQAYQYLDTGLDIYSQLLDAQGTFMSKQIDDWQKLANEAEKAYEYQKKIKDLTDSINTTRKQIAIYGTDSSEENRAVLQRLTTQLKEETEALKGG